MPKILIKTGEKKGLSFRIRDQEISIGRYPSNTVVLPDQRVSRAHARIVPKGKNYVIEDLGSVNGTHVNNAMINKQTLKLGDEITLGSTVLQFLSAQAPEGTGTEENLSGVRIVSEDETPSKLTVQLKIAPEKVPPLDKAVNQADAKSLNEAYHRLMTLYRISNDLGTVVDLSKLLDRIMEVVLEIIKADRGFVMLVDEETGELGGLQGVRKRKELEREDISISKTIIDQVMKTGESLLTSDALQDERLKEAESIIMHGIRSTMCVPIKIKDKILGIMHVDTKGKVVSFTKEDLELLTAICSQAAVAIENAKLFDDLKKANRELKEQQNQLIEAEKLSAVGQLASGVAHEINNPMTSILGYAELSSRQLAKGDLSGEELKECSENMKVVESEAHRCQLIVQSLLQFSRRRKDEMGSTDVNETIEASLTIAKFHIKGARMEIVKKLASDLPKIIGDPNQLQQVFLNFIVNAKDAMEKKGVLTITTSKADDHWVEVKFSDTGCGIPQDKLDEIFKPLYTSKEEGKGTGLGLSISQDIVERHKGTIEVESAVGQGTTFTIKLPYQK